MFRVVSALDVCHPVAMTSSRIRAIGAGWAMSTKKIGMVGIMSYETYELCDSCLVRYAMYGPICERCEDAEKSADYSRLVDGMMARDIECGQCDSILTAGEIERSEDGPMTCDSCARDMADADAFEAIEDSRMWS